MKAVGNSSTSIVCNLHDHDMEFNENGSVTFTVKYTGNMENTLLEESADILYNFSPNSDLSVTNLRKKINNAEQRVDQYVAGAPTKTLNTYRNLIFCIFLY